MARNGASLDLTDARSKAALSDGVSFVAEWTDTLAAGSWGVAGVSEQIFSGNGAMQLVKASVAAGASGRRFLRLRLTRP